MRAHRQVGPWGWRTHGVQCQPPPCPLLRTCIQGSGQRVRSLASAVSHFTGCTKVGVACPSHRPTHPPPLCCLSPVAAPLEGEFHAVLMDFGSTRPARVEVFNRIEALAVQEDAEVSHGFRHVVMQGGPCTPVWACGATGAHRPLCPCLPCPPSMLRRGVRNTWLPPSAMLLCADGPATPGAP